MATAIVTKNEGLEQLNERLTALVKSGEAIKVSDQSTCLQAKEFEVQCKSYEKAVELFADPDIQDAKERLASLQSAKKMLLAPMEKIRDFVKTTRRLWEEEERKRAEAEQRRLQEEARKQAETRAEEERKQREKEIAKQVRAGEIGKREAASLRKQADVDARFNASDVPQVKVQAAIPAIQGVASRRTWKFRIVDENKIPRKYMIPAETFIGVMVRNAKDKAKAEAECPGIEVWSE